MSELVIPPHVPQHLVRDFKYRDQPDGRFDPHAAWKRLHDGPDIIWSPHYGGHWILTRAADIKAALLDHERFSSREVAIPVPPRTAPNAPIQFDRPDHTRLKAMGIPAFGPQAIGKIEPEIRSLANSLLDEVIDSGRCEFVGDFSLRLPIETFMKMAGMPLKDRTMLLEWMEISMRSPDIGARDTVQTSLNEYARNVLEDRLRQRGSDLVSELCDAAPDGRKATYDELLGYVRLLMAAGLDTVSSGMTFIMRFLAESARHRRQLLDDPSLIPNAVEEMLRRFGVSTPSRIVARGCVFNGVEMREGDMVLIPVTMGGLDERVFENPLEVDFRRPNIAQSLVFGTGIHRCIGSFLARIELRIGLEVWLKRVGDFSLVPDAPPAGVAGLVNSLTYLPLQWVPPSCRGEPVAA